MPILKGQVAIVTGGGRGFGRAIAQKLALEGSKVMVTARTRAQLQETVEIIRSFGGEAVGIPGDVTVREDVNRVVRAAQDQFGPVSLLVSNAGISGPFGPVWHVDPDLWWNAMMVHVRGLLLYSREVLPGMIEKKAGRIIVVSSLASQIVDENFSGYAVAKCAQVRFMEHIALEVKPFGISAFAIEPGTVYTDLAKTAIETPDIRRWRPGMLEMLTELREKTDPAEGLRQCADLCLRLASGECDILSGQYMDVREDLDGKVRKQQIAISQL